MCLESAYQQAQECFAATNALPPDPPTPPPPPTNTPNAYAQVFSETRPDSGPQPRLSAHPEDQSQASQCLKVELLDPVPDLVNNAGNAIVVDAPSLSTGGTAVSGVAADGAARLVIRISGGFDGQQLTLSIRAADPTTVDNTNNLPHPIGSLATVDGGTVSDSSLSVTLTNVQLSTGTVPMAFAQYFPPTDFSRGPGDDTEPSCLVSLQITSSQGEQPNVPGGANIGILRPPVVLVHGIWSNRSAWKYFNTSR